VRRDEPLEGRVTKTPGVNKTKSKVTKRDM
jgi:hypothetical protein